MFGLDTLFHKIIFGILSTISEVVDILINFIRITLGLDPMAGQERGENNLLQNIFDPVILKAFGVCVAASLVFTIAFAVIRLIKTHANEKEAGEVGVGKAVVGFFGSFASLFVIPLFAVSIILATSATATAIDKATYDNAAPQMSYSTDLIFSAVVEGDLTVEGEKWFIGRHSDYQIFDGNGNQIKGMNAVKLMYSGWDSSVVTYYSSENCTQVLDYQYKDMKKFDVITTLVKEDAYFDTFILPLLGSCVMFCALAMASVTVAQRLFSVLFLFVLSPLPASARPLDDGARYKKWSEIFLGKVLSGYGIVFALNLFFSLAPVLVAKVYFDDGFANGVARLLIYIAGVVFAMGANILISQLIGADSGAAERDQATQNFRAGITGLHAANSVTRTATRAVSRGGRFLFGRGRPALADAGAGAPIGNNSISKTIGGAMNGGGGAATATAGRAGGSVAGDRTRSGGGATSRARTVGGSLGAAGATLIKGNPLKAVGRAAKGAGRAIAGMRITRMVAGAGMLVAGVVAAPVRAIVGGGKAIGKGAKGTYYRTFGRNTEKGKAYNAARAQRSAERAEQKRQSKVLAFQQRYASASPKQATKMLHANTRKQERLQKKELRRSLGKKG